MKKFLLIAILIIFLFSILGIFLSSKNEYQIKISFKFNNQSAKNINDIFCNNFENQLLQIDKIKDVVSFCKENECNIYIKIDFLTLNKEKIINEIYEKTYLFSKNFPEIKTIDLNRKYNLKYNYFLIAYDKNNDYFNLDKQSEKILEKLLLLKISKNIKVLGVLDKAVYINYQFSDLLTLNLGADDICEIIKKNNIDINLFKNNANPNQSFTHIKGNYKNIEDIKNLTVFYKNKQFSAKLYDIFKIEKKVKEANEGYILLGNKKAIIYAISTKNPILNIFSYFKLKTIANAFPNEIDFKIINPNFKKKIEIYLDIDSNTNQTLEFYEKLIKYIKNKEDILALISFSAPKFKQEQDFTQTEKNKITLFATEKNIKKIKKILDKENIVYFINPKIKYDFEFKQNENFINTSTQKRLQQIYNIDEYLMRDNKLSKKEVLNSLLSQNDGLTCGYYFEDDKIYEILLKENSASSENYIYSNDYKTLINATSFIKKELENDYTIISKKNKKFFRRLIKK